MQKSVNEIQIVVSQDKKINLFQVIINIGKEREKNISVVQIMCIFFSCEILSFIFLGL